MNKRNQSLDLDRAEAMALSALAFLAEDATRLGRFLAVTGLGPATLRAEAQSPQLLGAILGYLLEDESLLLVFTGMKGIDATSVAPAHDLLMQAARHGDTP